MNTSQPIARGLIAVMLCVCVPACSRRWFRTQADTEAYNAIREKGGYLDRGKIYPDAASRLHDPYSIDSPPMPPDDPRSNQLMCRVDGKPGYDDWGKFGHVGSVESQGWLETLPHDDDGTIQLDLNDAVRVARVNSRDYQTNLETLYLSALDVTFERFQFDHQIFAGNRIGQAYRGRKVGGSSETTIDSFAGFNKLSATGGELVVGLANSLFWDSWGSGSDLFTSTLDFTLVQPLLRFGGRARVLERLTQSERNMLANVRQMQQFRQGFYVNVATGRNSGNGPSLGNNVGQAGLGLIAGLPSGRSGAPSAGGYLGLLQDQQQIRNQATNIVALRDSLAQLEFLFEAGRISNRLQVDQARQALLNAQSSLLAAQAAYQSRVDSYKIDLGLPPELPIEIRDDLLDRFVLIDSELTELQDELSEVLSTIRKGRDNPTLALIQSSLQSLSGFDPLVQPHIETAVSDLANLNARLPDRKQQLQHVASQIIDLNADVDSRVYDESIMMERVQFLQQRLPQITKDLSSTKDLREKLQSSSVDAGPAWKELNKLAAKMSDSILELSLVHAEIRLQGITLLPIEIESSEALAAARLNRLDWMNARANLVDAWRKIEFTANDLKSNVDLVVDGQLATRPDNVLDFDDDRSRIRLGVEFDTPTARLAERNRYRLALINYQQARRDFMLFDDRVTQSLRNTIRIIELSQINLEVRRAAVQVAIAQVDNARLRLNPPARPDQPSRTSPTAARDLVSALTDLLDAQNDLLNVWVSYEVLRVLLDFEMGTMQLDPTGTWIDPGAVEPGKTPGLAEGEGLGDAIFELTPPGIATGAPLGMIGS